MNANTAQRLNELRSHASIGERLLIDEVVEITQGEPQDDLGEAKRELVRRAKKFIGDNIREFTDFGYELRMGGVKGLEAKVHSWVNRFENALDES